MYKYIKRSRLEDKGLLPHPFKSVWCAINNKFKVGYKDIKMHVHFSTFFPMQYRYNVQK